MSSSAVPKLRLNVLASALVVAGSAWAVQGYGELGGASTTSHPEWLWIGLACAALGLMMLVGVNPRLRRFRRRKDFR